MSPPQQRLDEDYLPGFVIVLTLIILSIIIPLVSQLYQHSVVHVHFNNTMIDREKAKQLALSGVNVAMSQLAIPQKKEGSDKKLTQVEQDKIVIKKVFPHLNYWQQIKITEENEKVEGIIKFSISCEDGKFNLNQLYDFTTHSFIKKADSSGNAIDGKALLSSIMAGLIKFGAKKNIVGNIESFLKKRAYKLNDPTGLLSVKDFSFIFHSNIFYEPPALEKTMSKESRPVYLMDIFTVWSDSPTINAWVLSDSIRALFGMQRASSVRKAAHEKIVAQIEKTYTQKKTSAQIKWDDYFKKLYGKDYKELPKILVPFLDARFEFKNFSVVSYGTVGNITQRVYAIIERKEPTKFVIKKLYWI